jgi:hypothetical protein
MQCTPCTCQYVRQPRMLRRFARVAVEILYAIPNVIPNYRKESSNFSDITAWSPLKISWRLGGTCRLYLQGRRISHARNQREAASSWMRCSSEMSVVVQGTTWSYISEDRTLHNHHCENLRFNQEITMNSCERYSSIIVSATIHYNTDNQTSHIAGKERLRSTSACQELKT